MDATIISWLSAMSAVVVRLAVWGFVLLNVAAVAGVLVTRSRSFVDRWTSPWLAANVTVIGAGIGVPIVAGLGKLMVTALAAPLGALAALIR